MSWGITIPNVYLLRVTKDELPTTLEEAEDELRDARERLLALACSTPRDVVHGEHVERWEDYVCVEVRELVGRVAGNAVRASLCRHAMDAIEAGEEVVAD